MRGARSRRTPPSTRDASPSSRTSSPRSRPTANTRRCSTRSRRRRSELGAAEEKVLERMMEADALTAEVKQAETALAAQRKEIDAETQGSRPRARRRRRRRWPRRRRRARGARQAISSRGSSTLFEQVAEGAQGRRALHAPRATACARSATSACGRRSSSRFGRTTASSSATAASGSSTTCLRRHPSRPQSSGLREPALALRARRAAVRRRPTSTADRAATPGRPGYGVRIAAGRRHRRRAEGIHRHRNQQRGRVSAACSRRCAGRRAHGVKNICTSAPIRSSW